MVEEWRDIEGYEGLYQISNKGRVKSLARKVFNGFSYFMKEESIKNPTPKPNGYLSLSLYRDGKEKRHYVHRLVSQAFIEKVEGKNDVNHIDGNKQNNNLSNLEWVTRSENINHAFSIGLVERGENHHSSKLTDEQVDYIKANYKRYDKKFGAHALGEMFNVSHQLISMIGTGKHRQIV